MPDLSRPGHLTEHTDGCRRNSCLVLTFEGGLEGLEPCQLQHQPRVLSGDVIAGELVELCEPMSRLNLGWMQFCVAGRSDVLNLDLNPASATSDAPNQTQTKFWGRAFLMRLFPQFVPPGLGLQMCSRAINPT